MSRRTLKLVLWLATLLSLATASPLSNHISLIERDNLTPEQRAADAGTGLVSQGGLSVWFGIGGAIRNAMRQGKTTLPILDPVTGKMVFDIKTIVMFYIPVLVFVVLILLLLVGTGCAGCCLCCCCRRKLLRRRKAYTTSDRLVAIIFLVLLLACGGVAILGGWRGSALISTGIQLIFSVTNTTVADVQLKIASVIPGANSILGVVSTTVNSSIDGVVTQLGLDTLSANASPIVASLAATLIAMQGSIDTMLLNVTKIGWDYGNLTSILEPALIGDLNYFNSQLQTLSGSQNNAGSIFQLQQALPTMDVTQAGGNFSGVSPTPSDLNNMVAPATTMPNLVTMAHSITSLFNSLTTTASTTISQSTGPIKNQVATLLNGAQTTVNSTFGPISDQVNSDIASYATDNINKYSILALQYDSYRNYGYMAIFILCIIWLFVPLLCIVAKKPKGTKCCTLFAVPFIVILYLLALLHFIFAYAMGEVCFYAFAQNMSIAQPLLGNSTYQYIGYGFQAQAMCSQGSNLIDVAVALNVVPASYGINSTTVSLHYQAQNLLNGLNLNSLVNSVNLNSTFSLSSSNLASQLAPVNTSLTNITSLNTTTWKNQASRPILGTAWQTLLTSLTTLNTVVTTGSDASRETPFAWTPPASPNIGDVNYWITLWNPVYTNISNYNATSPTIAAMNAKMAESVVLLDGLQGFVPTLQGDIATLLTLNTQLTTVLNNYLGSVPTLLTTGITTLESNILTAADLIQLQVNNLTECAVLANDTLALEHTLCTVFVGAFDSLWMAFLVLACCGTASLAVFVVAANRLADKTAREAANESIYQKKGKKSKTDKWEDDDEAPAPQLAVKTKGKRNSGRGQQQQVLHTAEMSPVSPGAGSHSFRGKKGTKDRSSSNSSNKVEPMGISPVLIDEAEPQSVLVAPGSRTMSGQDRAAYMAAMQANETDPAMESHSAFLAAMAQRAYNNSDPAANGGVMQVIDENGLYVNDNGIYPTISMAPPSFQDPSHTQETDEMKLDAALDNLIHNIDARNQSNRTSQAVRPSATIRNPNPNNLELDLTRLISRNSSTSPQSAYSNTTPSPDGEHAPLLKPGYVAPPSLPANFTIRGSPNETIRVVASSPGNTLPAPVMRGNSSLHQENAAAYLEARRTSRASKSSRH
ncbi:hypothetical protein SmJEL517_g06156 [Synchytrium microbalum]|uniref:Plasma membrane fusion protein PRM1 n=1 Tax=Synchytrium microbalum TaxID=1806994 RepID=A0A507BJZ3_9FUNG|nr:uncharacterized protein SmJEL517_g06156 [Synchytrium microbalum]TPX30237.1 hypothetical protein SmJEL517_g06156 [Synchytrium microbalum]